MTQLEPQSKKSCNFGILTLFKQQLVQQLKKGLNRLRFERVKRVNQGVNAHSMHHLKAAFIVIIKHPSHMIMESKMIIINSIAMILKDYLN